MPEIVLGSEFLPATGEPTCDVVLLHGWASSREIWRPILAQVRDWANVTLVDLPGCSFTDDDIPAFKLMDIDAAIMALAPDRSIFLGWSLGGQLAARLCDRYPERATGLITLGCNPHFLAAADWPGMPPGDFTAFRKAVIDDPAKALRRFDSLQSDGSDRPRDLVRILAASRSGIVPETLLAGLDELGASDHREMLRHLEQPQLHLLGGSDALVPVSLAESLLELLKNLSSASVVTLAGKSHVLPVDAASEVAEAIRGFTQDNGLQPLMASSAGGASQGTDSDRLAATAASKKAVAESFSRAAADYDSVAQLQREVGTRLLESTRGCEGEVSTILDLGCGTGYFYPFLAERFPAADYMGLDLADGMIEYARGQYPQASDWLVGDAESLPLAAESVDLIFSSLAIQWCHSPDALFAELQRVLKPGGRCVFTSLGPETLKELRMSWASVDDHQHVNTFLHSDVLLEAAEALSASRLLIHAEQFNMRYQRVRELLDELRTLGAHNMNKGRAQGLTGRKKLQGMLSAYESWRADGWLPATYDVQFGILEKL